MANIGGNITGIFQTKTYGEKNAMGEREVNYKDVFRHKGWLDLQNGDSKYSNFSTKMEESTHIFLCDYHEGIYAQAAKDTRMILKGFAYDVLLIDNPMEMNEQLEIYLRRVGAWNG